MAKPLYPPLSSIEHFSSLGSNISIDISKASIAQKVEKLPVLGAPKSNAHTPEG
jgi:hypothetical protein